jgi:hypothetical protein
MYDRLTSVRDKQTEVGTQTIYWYLNRIVKLCTNNMNRIKQKSTGRINVAPVMEISQYGSDPVMGWSAVAKFQHIFQLKNSFPSGRLKDMLRYRY